VLALLGHQNRKLLRRQGDMYAQPLHLWERWMQACDYLEQDLESGYVRVLQEMIAAGWSDPEIGTAVRDLWGGWSMLLRQIAAEAVDKRGGPPGFTPEELATLAGSLFISVESMILLGFTEEERPARSALRKIGAANRAAETKSGGRSP
jgi:hypothetical protein